MLRFAEAAVQRAPDRPDAAFLLADAQRVTGDVAGARAQLSALETRLPRAATPWALLSAKYAELGQVEDSLRAANTLQSLQGGARQGRGLAAAALTALGRMDEAERLYDQLISAHGDEVDAYYQRAILRRARTGEAAIDQTRERLRREPQGAPNTVPLHFALGKMLEDIGELDDAFDQLEAGAKARRARLAYRVEEDEAVIDAIIKTFNADWVQSAACAETQPGPLFVMGLPRSGTTLVERILASHSQAESLGEINDLAYAVMGAGGPSGSKLDLITRAAGADMAALGAQYRRSTAGYGADAPVLIDKTPANFLYAGLIAAALPGARIVHLRRHPVASGYAMFKTLFRMGYPFSYDLRETARYIAAHRRLIMHWRAVMPRMMTELAYEALVDAPEPTARALLHQAGLDWEPACLKFHANPAPVATASAAQVREPVHTRSRDAWRDIEHRLAPLIDMLDELGVPQ